MNLGFGISLWILMLCLTVTASSHSQSPLSQLVPQEIDGWSLSSARRYDRATLSKYLDGAAELYLSYGFREMVACRLEKKGQPQLVVDLFDMGSPEEAFGVFSEEREEAEAGIGQGSEYAAGLLRFWQGRYFVSVWTDKESPTTRKGILAIGASIARSIGFSGRLPELARLLPRQGLIVHRIRFFHDHLALNRHHFLGNENVLGLSKRTKVVLAPYRTAEGTSKLLLVEYSSSRQAESAVRAFLGLNTPEHKAMASYVRVGKEDWVGAKRDGKMIILVLQASTKHLAEELIAATSRRLQKEHKNGAT